MSKLEDLEIKEMPGNVNPVFISGEKLNLSDNEELQFGKNRLNNLFERIGKEHGSFQIQIYTILFYRDDINISLNYLDRIHNGPGVFPLEHKGLLQIFYL